MDLVLFEHLAQSDKRVLVFLFVHVLTGKLLLCLRWRRGRWRLSPVRTADARESPTRRYDEARTTARDALTAARDVQWSLGFALTLQHLAAVAGLRANADAPVIEDRRRAACILGYVNGRLTALEVTREYTEEQEYDAMLTVLRDVLGADRLAQLMTEGTTWSEDQAVAEAMLI